MSSAMRRRHAGESQCAHLHGGLPNKRRGVSWFLPLVVAGGAGLSTQPAAALTAHAATAYTQRVVLDGVPLTVSAPFLGAHSLRAAAAGNAHQVAAAFGRDGAESLAIIAVPYGSRAAGESLPRAGSGSVPQ